VHRQERPGRISKMNFHQLIPFRSFPSKPTNRYPLKYIILTNPLHPPHTSPIKMLSALPRTLARSSLRAGGVIRPVALGMFPSSNSASQIRHCPESSRYFNPLQQIITRTRRSSLVLRTRDSDSLTLRPPIQLRARSTRPRN
jgi:hypothetical protein